MGISKKEVVKAYLHFFPTKGEGKKVKDEIIHLIEDMKEKEKIT